MVGDPSRTSQSLHGTALAFLLRLAVPFQWARVSPVESGERASSSRPFPIWQRAQADRHLYSGTLKAEIPEGRGGEAIQRSAEARLSRRGPYSVTTDATYGPRHVAGNGRRLPLSC